MPPAPLPPPPLSTIRIHSPPASHTMIVSITISVARGDGVIFCSNFKSGSFFLLNYYYYKLYKMTTILLLFMAEHLILLKKFLCLFCVDCYAANEWDGQCDGHKYLYGLLKYIYYTIQHKESLRQQQNKHTHSYFLS